MHSTPHVLLLNDISQSSGREFCKGFSKYSQIHGGWVLYVNSPYNQDPMLKEITAQDIRQWTVHGIVDNLTNCEKTIEILSLGLPTIVTYGLQTEILGKYSILVDNTGIAEMGAQHFIDRKIKNFAYCGFDSLNWSINRGKAFENIIAKAGGSVHTFKQPHIKDVHLWENELPYLAEWLKTLPKPVGLMACSDNRGQHIVEACRVANLHVPEEVAIIGVDNDDFICELTHPSLTSICVNNENVGYQSAEILHRLMIGDDVPPQKLWLQGTGISVRRSTDIMAINDNEVKQAIRFIRLNCMKSINVLDVAEHLSMTVRTLDRRFSKSLGRSVHSEIIRMRIERAAHMLTETNFTISQIAYQLGYSELKHLTQAFKREKGIGPLAYRKAHGNIYTKSDL